MDYPITPKAAFADICSMPDLCQIIIEAGTDNSDLAVFLHEKNYFNSPERSLPTLKELGNQLKVPPHKLGKWILSIHSKLMELFEDDDFNIILKGSVEYHLKNRDRYMTFRVEGQPSLPRIGETVNVQYFRKYMGTSRYFVKDIYHEVENGQHIINVDLETGFYNLYWHIRKDEAFAKHELSIHELFMDDDWDLKAKLRISHYWCQVDDERRERQREKVKPRRKKNK